MNFKELKQQRKKENKKKEKDSHILSNFLTHISHTKFSHLARFILQNNDFEFGGYKFRYHYYSNALHKITIKTPELNFFHHIAYIELGSDLRSVQRVHLYNDTTGDDLFKIIYDFYLEMKKFQSEK